METLITIFTPTYNRAKELKQCYVSLKHQTNKNFIWQIIDDGSTDNTFELVTSWIEEDKVDIQYYKKKNGGKASCINYSLDITKTPLWLCLDSDDYLFQDAVEKISHMYLEIEDNDTICGIFGLRSKPDGRPMQNKQIPEDLLVSTQSYIRYTLQIPPEYIHVFKTEIKRKYRYPIIENEKYMPLSYVFDQIDQSFDYLITKEPLMVCEYRDDGMTKNKRKLIKENPNGYRLYKLQAMKLAPNFKEKIKATITYNTACILSKSKTCLRDSPQKLLTLLCYPLGIIDYLLRY